MMKRLLPTPAILSLLVIAFPILLAPPLEIRGQPQDEKAIAEQFVGTWRLVSWPERLNDGAVKQNTLSVAYLIYTDDGHVCFVAMNPNRSNWKTPSRPTSEEVSSGLSNDNFYSYCGTFEIHTKEGFVVHHAEIDKIPNRVGGTRKRWFKFEGPNRLSLRLDQPQTDTAANIVESTLVWERVGK